MITVNYTELLVQSLFDLKNNQFWLERSYKICLKIGIKPTYTPEEFDAFEILTSRFSRTTDFLVNKMYRTIDSVEELEQRGTLIDVLNRAHKRKLIDSIQEIRDIKELRNELAHEYTSRELKKIFEDVLNYSPKVMKLIDKVNHYCQKHLP